MGTIKSIKERAKSLCEGRENHYYLRKYGDLSVGELLVVLEDDNWHTAETLLECLAHQNYEGMLEACEITLEAEDLGSMSQDLLARRKAVDDFNRELE